jgi:hypothetical protein
MASGGDRLIRGAHETLSAEFAEAFEPFKVDGGYALPGVALCVVAS